MWSFDLEQINPIMIIHLLCRVADRLRTNRRRPNQRRPSALLSPGPGPSRTSHGAAHPANALPRTSPSFTVSSIP